MKISGFVAALIVCAVNYLEGNPNNYGATELVALLLILQVTTVISSYVREIQNG